MTPLPRAGDWPFYNMLKYILASLVWLTVTASACPDPDNLPTAYTTVTPTSHTSWPTGSLRLTGGDYTALGTLNIGTASGTASDPLAIWSDSEAKVAGVMVSNDVHDWIIRGLTLDTPLNTGMIHVLKGTSITLHRNVIKNSPASYGIRVRDGNYVCITENLIHTSTAPANNDAVGINIKPNTRPIYGLSISGNEIYDWVDAIQITNQYGHPIQFNIFDNDLYTTSAKYVQDPVTGKDFACTENAIDIKAASYGISRIEYNRMWGFRETPPADLMYLCDSPWPSNLGSAGDAIVLHIEAKDIKIENNVIGDAVHGVRDSYLSGGRNLSVNWNYFYEIPAANANVRFYGGAVLVVEDDVDIISNWFAYTPLICPASPWPPSGWTPAAPLFIGNGFIGTTSTGVCTGSNWNVTPTQDYVYTRKLLSGPETYTIVLGKA